MGAAAEAFRNEVRDWLARHWTPERRAAHLKKPFKEHGWDPDFSRLMGRDGWIGVGWPRKFGGQGRGPTEQIAFVTEMANVGAPVQAQDAAAGEKVFVQCRACHQVGETAKNAVGPVLNGLFGRKSGTVEGYNYSDANKNSGIVWDEAVFAEYIQNPRAKIPGTKMIYAGLKDEKRIKDLTAFLKQYDKDGKKAAQ